MKITRHQATATPEKWYSLNPRTIRLRHIITPVLLLIAIFCVSEKHIWRWDWNHGFHAWYNCHAVKDADGKRIEAWRWVEGREIRLYVPSDMAESRVEQTADGIRSLTGELHLEISVHVFPTDHRINLAIQKSTEILGNERSVNFDRLCRELVATRDGKYAEIVITPGILDGSPDTMGLAYFSYGVAVLDEQCTSGLLARHETGHLLGYHLHDDLPFIVFGYSNPQWGKLRRSKDASLMMPEPDGKALSSRAHDALVSFWQCLERRTGQTYFLH